MLSLLPRSQRCTRAIRLLNSILTKPHISPTAGLSGASSVTLNFATTTCGISRTLCEVTSPKARPGPNQVLHPEIAGNPKPRTEISTIVGWAPTQIEQWRTQSYPTFNHRRSSTEGAHTGHPGSAGTSASGMGGGRFRASEFKALPLAAVQVESSTFSLDGARLTQLPGPCPHTLRGLICVEPSSAPLSLQTAQAPEP